MQQLPVHVEYDAGRRVGLGRVAGLLEDYAVHDWGADPYAGGASSYVTMGGCGRNARSPSR